MKKIIAVFFIFHLSSLIFASPVSAHVLKADGSIGAILHVSPEDDPIAGVATDFFFEIKDKENAFKPVACECTAAVYQNGKMIYSQPLFQNNASPSLEDASFSYALPQKDIYKVQISGKSNDGSFEPFALTWDLRVSRDNGSTPSEMQNNMSEALPYIFALGLVVLIVGLSIGKKSKSRKT